MLCHLASFVGFFKKAFKYLFKIIKKKKCIYLNLLLLLLLLFYKKKMQGFAYWADDFEIL